MNIIEVKNLKKMYKDFTAVNNISFDVKKGSIFGMLGPNGAGKTTTIECVVGIKKAKYEKLDILGKDIKTYNKNLYDFVGVQLQETSYQDKVKVGELCKAFSSMYDQPRDYMELLEIFNLSKKTNSYVNELSGGQKQKVAITLALIGNPQIIFLDELTTGLDPKSRREMWELVLKLKEQGITVFMTTHYMEEASYLCDKIAIINHGEILAIEDVEGIIKKAKLKNIVSFESNSDFSDLLQKELSELTSDLEIFFDSGKYKICSSYDDIISEVVILLRKNAISYSNINLSRPTLEDAYLKLIENKEVK